MKEEIAVDTLINMDIEELEQLYRIGKLPKFIIESGEIKIEEIKE